MPFSCPHPVVALCAGIAAFTLGELRAATPPEASSSEGIEFFEKKIRPVLTEQCLKCHGGDSEKVKGGLRLDTRANILKGGETGPAAVVGDVQKSLLIEAVRYGDEDLQMPPKHRLDPSQVADLEQWVVMGLPDPRTSAAAPAVKPSASNIVAGKDFWSMRPARAVAPPSISNPWAWSEVDRFVLAKLDEKSLKPNPDASKRDLLRRATFDLTGLPPTSEEMDAFLSDDSPAAFTNVVDRLLASTRYGEQWGRHWLDVVRYADTSGCNSDFPIPTASRYRDYVVAAFNKDKPFDAFVREQIAGDLLPAANDAERFEHIIATGYLAISRRFGSRNNEFHLTIDDTIDNVGKAMLGLSVGCARCHDHKFDPILAKDYYALYGIFASTRYAFPGTEIYRHTKDFVPLAPKEIADQFLTRASELAGLDDKIESLKGQKTRAEREEQRLAKLPQTDPESPAFVGPPAKEAPKQKTGAECQAEIAAAYARQKELEAQQGSVDKAYAVSEGTAHDAKIQKKGDPGALGEEAPRAFLTVLGGATLPPEEHGSGRLELAEWIADSQNPLTARVMVNRIWQHHFGKGIVKTPNDFGTRGERPTDPELLDWLAVRFVSSGWSVKAIHRLILLSHAYRISSEENPAAAAADSNNDFLWRFNRRRLSAEEIRDAMLFTSGALDESAAGPHPFPPEAEWHYTQHKPFIADYPTNKRSIYLLQQRIRKQPYLDIFDGADTNATTGVRPLSTTPTQALFFLNSDFTHDQAHKLAARAESAGDGDAPRIDMVYRIVLGRSASPEEQTAVGQYLARVTIALQEAGSPSESLRRDAFASFCRMLYSSNEFLFVE